MNADVVFAWNEALLTFSSPPSSPIAPQLEARAAAMAHIAIHDAIVTAGRQSAGGEARLAAQRAAAVCAAHDVLEVLLPERARQFDALASRHLGAIPEGADKARGIGIGRAAAASILQRREKDGWSELAMFSPPAGPMPEPSASPPAAMLKGAEPPPSPWLRAKPFFLKSVEQFPAREPRSVGRNGEVQIDSTVLHSKLFDAIDRAAVGSGGGFWSQRPVAVWNRIARQIAAERAADLTEQARLLAVLNSALADATVTALHWRHTIGTWRVIIADVWEGIGGETPMSTDVLAQVDDGLQSVYVRHETRRILIAPTPDFPAVAATVAGAAQAALAGFFRTDAIAFALPSSTGPNDADPAPRVFASISGAAKECAFAAGLDGRHCREACVSGYSLGQAVGNYVNRRIAATMR